jgi:hypothetical protein
MTCFAAAMVLLGHWLSIKARNATTASGALPAVAGSYNSSSSVINAIFMMVNVFGVSALGAARPMFSIPAVEYTIFIMIGFVYGLQEGTEQHSIRFTKEIIYSFLTGQAIATAVSLLIIPVSSRKVFFGEATGFLQSARGLLKAQLAFVEALEHSGLCEVYKSESDLGSKANIDSHKRTKEERVRGALLYEQKAADLKGASVSLLGLSGKLRDDVVFARREMAFGHLGSSDVNEICRLLREIMLPISGVSTVADISDRLKNRCFHDERKFEEAQCPETRSQEF